jgi:hypothetical protein
MQSKEPEWGPMLGELGSSPGLPPHHVGPSFPE